MRESKIYCETWSSEMDAPVAQCGEDRLPASGTVYGGCGPDLG